MSMSRDFTLSTLVFSYNVTHTLSLSLSHKKYLRVFQRYSKNFSRDAHTTPLVSRYDTRLLLSLPLEPQ